MWTNPGEPCTDETLEQIERTEIGRRLRRARMRAGYTQAQAAAALGYESDSRGGVKLMSYWETKKLSFRIEDLQAVADLYGVPVSYFYDLEFRK